MSNWTRALLKPLVLSGTAAVLLATSLRLPLWNMRMEAPQYKDEESLRVTVYPGEMRGDLSEIQVLNQYIGVHIPETLPQLKWLPTAIMAAGVCGLAACFLPVAARRRALMIVPLLLSLALVAAAAQAQWQMYQIGHSRDQKTRLVGVKDFTPVLVGKVKIAQFDVTAMFAAGAWLIAAAIALQLAASRTSRRRPRAQDIPAAEQGRSVRLHEHSKAAA